MKAIVFALLAFAVSCTPRPVSPPTPDASDAAPPSHQDASADAPASEAGQDVYAAACGKLAELDCPEGDDVSVCARTLRHVAETHLTDLSPACVAAAQTQTDVRACVGEGGIRPWRNGCHRLGGSSL